MGEAASSPGSSSAPTSPRSAAAPLVPLRACVVVEDVQSNSQFFVRLLKRRGVETVHVAADGFAALSLFGELAPAQRAEVQCWFIDKEMPGCDGHELAWRLRGLGVREPIIGVSGNALVEDRRLFIEAGASAAIPKPVRAEHIEAVLLEFGLGFERAAATTAIAE